MIGNPDLIKYNKGFMNAEDAQKIYEYAIKTSSNFDEYGNDKKEFLTNNKVFNNEFDLKIRDLMQSYAKKVYEYVVATYSNTKFYPFKENLTHIAKFSDGDSMHEHFDLSRPNDIATLIYLNNNYEGGEIYFPEYNIYIKPSPGDLVTFPDNEYYIHGVKKVYNGDRYTMPRWFTRLV